MPEPTLPNPASSETTRFEAAPDPDGTLIPIPTAAGGKPIRDDAQITVSPRGQNGYYVSIYNGAPNPPSTEVKDFLDEVLSEAHQQALEMALLESAPAVLEFSLAAAGVLASVLTTSPILAEDCYRGTMEDGVNVTYVVLTPHQP